MTLNIGVFCGSKIGINPKHSDLTVKLGNWIGRNNHNIVFGGGHTGLMKKLTKESSKFKIKVFGIIPSYLFKESDDTRYITDLIITKNLDQRMKQFIARSDCFIALPGGIGTMNEILDIMVKNELSEYKKKIFLINDTNFWGPFKGLINFFIAEKFLDLKTFNAIVNISSLNKITKKIEKIDVKNQS